MVVKDQLHRTINVISTPKRIVSLVPSQTEFLVDAGLGDRLVGVTKFCVYPKGLKNRATIVGGTKSVKIDIIQSLQPDLVIANKEENLESDIAEIEHITNVWVSDIHNEIEAFNMMESLNQLLGLEFDYSLIKQKMKKLSITREDLGSVLYLIWRNPYMAAGNDTFIDRMLEISGFKNILWDKSRYPEISLEHIKELQPDHIFLSSEPFPFKEKHILELEDLFPNSKIRLVDGEVFSWYGTRMTYAMDYIVQEFYE